LRGRAFEARRERLLILEAKEYMADEKDSGSAPQQKPGVSPTVFWVVVVLLAIGIGAVYMVLENKLDSGTKTLSELIKNSSEKQAKDLQTQNETINKAIADAASKQDATNKSVSEMIAKNQTEVTASLGALDKKLTAQVADTSKGFEKVEGTVLETKQSIGKVDNRVTYIEKDVKELQAKVTGLDSQIGEIKTGSAALKAEQARLLSEIKSVAQRSNVSDAELASLVQRTRDFELRVLMEHAKSAADNAKKYDYEKLFEVMDFAPKTPSAPKKEK